MISLNTTALSASAGRVRNKTARFRTVRKRNKKRDINGSNTCSRFPGKLQGGSVLRRIFLSRRCAKHQAPNPKLQRSSKSKTPNPENKCRGKRRAGFELGASLEFGIWSFLPGLSVSQKLRSTQCPPVKTEA